MVVPAVCVLRLMPRVFHPVVGLLVWDDPHLGKTIVAAILLDALSVLNRYPGEVF